MQKCYDSRARANTCEDKIEAINNSRDIKFKEKKSKSSTCPTRPPAVSHDGREPFPLEIGCHLALLRQKLRLNSDRAYAEDVPKGLRRVGSLSYRPRHHRPQAVRSQLFEDGDTGVH